VDNAIYSALYTKLAGGTALAALVGGTAAPRIYHSIAPDNATAPYVVFDWVAGGYSATSQHVEGEGIFRIRAISTAAGTGAKEAGAIAKEVYNLLDRSDLGTITGFTHISLFAEPPHIDWTEPTEKGSYISTSGDDYRLRVEKT
jgi:hypothetical protein